MMKRYAMPVLFVALFAGACAVEDEAQVEGEAQFSVEAEVEATETDADPDMPTDQVRPAAAPCWAYTFVHWGTDAAGSQCRGGTFGWQHRGWIRCAVPSAPWVGRRFDGPWVGGTSKSTVTCPNGWVRVGNGNDQGPQD